MMAAPKIRFKGFEDDWVQRKLGEVVNVYDGTHQTPNYTDSGIMFLSVENIKTLQSDKFIGEDDFDREFKIFPEYGDILMTRIGDIGTANVVRTTNKIAYYVSLALMKPQQVDSDFLATAISSESTQSEIWERTLHVAFPKKINKNEIEKLNIVIPQKDEQKKIGNLFRTLDDSIALSKRKVDCLKGLKRGYLQQMFPQTEERVPRVRFAEFSGNWEQRKADDIFISVADKNHPNLPVLSASQEFGMVLRDKIGIDIKFDENSTTAYKRVLPGQFVIHLRSFQGGFAYSSIEGITSPAYTVLGFKPDTPNNSLFWREIFRSDIFIKRLETVTYGIRDGRSISFSDFSTLIFSCPTIEEQTAIGSFFRNLDEQIATQQAKLDKLKQLKTAYLQRMFV